MKKKLTDCLTGSFGPFEDRVDFFFSFFFLRAVHPEGPFRGDRCQPNGKIREENRVEKHEGAQWEGSIYSSCLKGTAKGEAARAFRA